MTGLKRGTVRLEAHQDEWVKSAESVIGTLNDLLGSTAVEIQHIGSTAIFSIHAKPIIDLVVGVNNVNDVLPYLDVLKKNGFTFRGEDVEGQFLFVMGDLEHDVRTHHIHVVKWNGCQWKHYLDFRDYLNTFPEKAMAYDHCKQKLAAQFPDNRRAYTAGKQHLIEILLEEADIWRTAQ